MPVAEDVHPFWRALCPAPFRAGLRHVHDRHCTAGHEADQCCECGGTARDFEVAIRRAHELREAGVPADANDGLPRRATTGQDDRDAERRPIIRDHETGAVAEILVRRSMTPRQARRLTFLAWLAKNRPESIL